MKGPHERGAVPAQTGEANEWVVGPPQFADQGLSGFGSQNQSRILIPDLADHLRKQLATKLGRIWRHIEKVGTGYGTVGRLKLRSYLAGIKSGCPYPGMRDGFA